MFRHKTDEKTKRLRKEIHGKMWIFDYVGRVLIVVLMTLGLIRLLSGLWLNDFIKSSFGVFLIMFAFVSSTAFEVRANRRILSYLAKKEND